MKNFREIRERYSSKFPPALIAAAVKIALDMGGNMTGAFKKIERMKKGLGDDPVVKDALRLANENVQKEETLNELNFSYAFFDKQSLNKFMMKAKNLKGLTVVDTEKQTGGHFTVRVKSDDKKIIAKANTFAMKAMAEWVDEINPQETIITIEEKLRAGKGKGTADVDYIGDKELTKKLEKKFKVKIKNTGNTTADIIGNKQNVLNFLMNHYYMDADEVEELYPEILEAVKKLEALTEAYSKNLSDKEIDKQFKFFGSEKKAQQFFGDLDQARAELKQDYSPKNSARPNAWTSLRYPVRNGDYYFAFISDNMKKNMKFNEKLNDHLKETFKALTLSKKDVVRDVLWEKASLEVKTYPRDLGAGDTMTRDEIWASIGHMVGMNEDVQEMRNAMKTDAGIRVGKRKKAPKYHRG